MLEHSTAGGPATPRKHTWWRVSPAIVILLAFFAGLGSGAVMPSAAPYIAPFGTVWVKAISALVVPLVVALLITGITSLADARAMGRLGARALVVFLALLTAGGALVALVTPTLLTLLHVTSTSAGALVSATSPRLNAAPVMTGFWGWIEALIPVNPVAAAAGGTLLPLVVFTVAFAVATARLSPEPRAHVVGFFRGVADVMLELVRWVLWAAPAGVFALAYALGARTGLGSARLLVALVLVVAAACLVFLCALYALAVLLGGIPLLKFSRAIARAQLVAFSSRSSLAALPAMIEAAEASKHGDERDTGLALPVAVTAFLLPLAVSTFKLGATIAIVTGTLFLARLYAIPITPAQLISITVSAVLLSFSVPGIPGGVLLIMVPVLAGVSIPAEGIGILLAVDTIPDMFRTLTNVTADMVAAVLVARSIPKVRE